MLMTRPHAASRSFVASLPKNLLARLKPVYNPLIKIISLKYGVSISNTEAAIFTSMNGVIHGPKGNGQKAYCVGAATTQIALEHGWAAHMYGETAEAFLSNLINNPPALDLIHLSGIHTRGNIASQLMQNGLKTKNVAVYDQITQHLKKDVNQLILSGAQMLVPLFSPRTSKQFSIQVPRAPSLQLVALSQAVAQNLDTTSYAGVIIVTAPTAAAMQSAISLWVEGQPAYE
jgi:uroporphyrinogen-III synthase